ncbi:arylesterase [Marinomonas epiphytica]
MYRKLAVWLSAIFFTFICSLANASNLLVLGDSLSAAHNLKEQQGWVSLLSERLSQSHPSIKVINASSSGETTQGGLSRAPALFKEYNPQWLILELGANDALRGYPLQQTRANLGKIIELAQSSQTQVLILGNQIPQNYGKRYTQMFFGLFKDLAEQYTTAYVPFMLENVALNPILMQSDGLHPTAEGQPIVLDNIYPTLIELLD